MSNKCAAQYTTKCWTSHVKMSCKIKLGDDPDMLNALRMLLDEDTMIGLVGCWRTSWVCGVFATHSSVVLRFRGFFFWFFFDVGAPTLMVSGVLLM